MKGEYIHTVIFKGSSRSWGFSTKTMLEAG